PSSCCAVLRLCRVHGACDTRDLHSFPTRRSSDLLEGLEGYKAALNHVALTYPTSKEGKEAERILNEDLSRLENMDFKMDLSKNLDRKSTRLNSSHVKISYAVFCLKNKPGSISLFS